jgi:hypothetical protein
MTAPPAARRHAEAGAAFAAYVRLRPKAALHTREALRCADGSLQASPGR